MAQTWESCIYQAADEREHAATVAKALGAPGNLRWLDAEVVRSEKGRPVLHLHGGVAEEAAAQGIRTWHLSLAHDGGVATAFVVAES